MQEEADVRLRVKTYNLKTDDFRKMRDLEPTDIEKLISTNGIVIRCSDLIPDMAMAMFACTTEGCSEQVQVAVNKFRIVKHSFTSFVHCTGKITLFDAATSLKNATTKRTF